jgi:uncharacterized protein (TIGR01777 family)
MRYLLAGSSGLIGTALSAHLGASGHEVRRLVRPESAGSGIPWDPARGELDPSALDGVDVVVNLSGRSIGERRWSDAEKRLLRDSRVDPTRLLAEAIAARADRPAVLVNASAVGFYGDGGDRILTEQDPPGSGFFPDLCTAWEAATAAAADAGVRVVSLRTGIVLSDRGGVVSRLLAPLGPRWISPYRWGLGGPVAGGRQYWSWLSLQDALRAIDHLVAGDLAGPVNLMTPAPVTNREFTKALGRALHRPTVLPIPGFVVKAVLGSELARATVLEGQRAIPARLEGAGFEFRDTDLDRALREALGR